MERENITAEQMPTIEYQDRKIRKRTFSILFLIASILLSIFGFYKMYAYGTEDKVVGGDAYNFIILAGRGTGWICGGIVAALIGVAIAIFDLTDKQK